jgi:hypothetical protein
VASISVRGGEDGVVDRHPPSIVVTIVYLATPLAWDVAVADPCP